VAQALHPYELIDTHAHLEEIADLEAALERARQAGVVAVIAVGSNYASNFQVLEMAERFPRVVYPALGLHPAELGEMGAHGVERTLGQMEEHLARAVAVGEVGLDYHKRVRAAASKEWQQGVLREVLSLARRQGKPAIIHSRYAWGDALALVQQAGVEAVFHWYTGTSSVLRGLVAAGCFTSATPAVAYHEEHRRAVRQVPVERLLLETDSPVSYRCPDGSGRYPAEPAHLARVLSAVAVLRGMPEALLATQSTRNARRLFGLTGGR